jgi:thiamine biosynthesis lipoprotein
MEKNRPDATATTRARIVRLLALGAACLAFATAHRTRAAEPIVLHGRTMGTTYNVKYWSDAENALRAPELQRSIDGFLARFDAQFSTWRPDSELSRFNAAEADQWFPVSPDVAKVAVRALELHRLTGGASDVTIGPVLRLWGFGAGRATPADRTLAPPSDDAIAAALECVGAENLAVQLDPPALRKEIAGLEVDLSSIAPGYAVDQMVELLADAGFDNAMVELGGEVRGVGRRPDGNAWRIGVQAPPPHERGVSRAVPLADLALATSGDFHNVRTINGAAVTHIIDPRTGRPIAYRGASITVIAPTCFAADGVATGLFVMGPEAAYAWCVEQNVAALFQAVDRDNNRVVLRVTPRFKELVPGE